jgi:beta-lactam-binding protein with PASTA domain
VVPAPDNGYLGSGDIVTQLSPDGQQGTPVPLDARITGQIVPDADEGVWVLTDDGKVRHVVRSEVRLVAQADRPIRHLTVADGRPIGLTDTGDLLDLSAQPLRRITNEPVPHGDGVVVGSAKGPGRWILVLDRGTGQLSAVDIRTGTLRTINDIPHGSGHDLGAPVQLDDRVYLPDFSKHVLHVSDLGSGRNLPDITVPGKSDTFSLEVRAGRVWANDQVDRRPVIIGSDGSQTLADKGKAPGQTDTSAPPAPPDKDKDKQDPPRPSDNPPSPPPAPPAEPKPLAEVEVPRIEPGTQIDQACQHIADVGLKCVPVAAGDGGPTNTVVNPTDPAAGTRVPRSSRVVVRHYGPAAVPNVVGQYTDNACKLVTDAKLKCVRQPLSGIAPDPKDLDVVKEQTPQADGKAATGSDVTIGYYNKAYLADYRNQPGAAACAALKQTYRKIECTVVEGASQLQTGKPPGYVYDHKPDPNAVVQMTEADQSQTVVTMTVAKGSPSVPPLIGQSPENACAILAQAGYGCDLRADQLARHRQVVSQEPAPGTPMDPGGTVIVHYAPHEPVELAMYRRDNPNDPNDDYVFEMGLAGDNPPYPGYTIEKQTIGWGYEAGKAGPGLAPLYDHYCVGSRSTCLGFSRNHYFSRHIGIFHSGWSRQAAPSVIATCSPGMVKIWRVWKIDTVDGIERHRYNVRNDDGKSAGFDDNELLGCLWAS